MSSYSSYHHQSSSSSSSYQDGDVSLATEEDIHDILDLLIAFRCSPEGQTPAPLPIPEGFARAFEGCEWDWADQWKDIMFDKWCERVGISDDDFL